MKDNKITNLKNLRKNLQNEKCAFTKITRLPKNCDFKVKQKN